MQRRRRDMGGGDAVAASVSLLVSLSCLGIGVAFLADPSSTAVRALAPCGGAGDEEGGGGAERTLARVVGSLFLSSFLSSFLLLLPSFRCHERKRSEGFGGLTAAADDSDVDAAGAAAAVAASDGCRVSLASQALLGALLLAAGLIDNGDGGVGGGGSACDEFRSAPLLAFGSAILVLACLGSMASFWPTTSAMTSESSAEDGRVDSRRSGRRRRGGVRRLLCCLGRRSGVEDDDPFGEAHVSSAPLLPRGDGGGSDVVPPGRRGDAIDEFLDEPVVENGDLPHDGGDAANGRGDASAGSGGEGEGIPTSRITGTRRLVKLASPEMPYVYAGCLVLLLRLPFSLSIPHFVSTTLGALSRSEYDSARADVLLLFLLGTVDAALDFWCVFLFGYANLRIVRGARINAFVAILRQEMAFFDEHSSGDLSSRLNSDCGEMASDLTWFFRFSIESIVRITGIALYMLIRSPVLGACALSIVPFVAIANKLYGDWLSRNALAVQNALADANAVAQEAFSCVRTVVAFSTEDFEKEKYGDKIQRQYDLSVSQLYMTGIYYMSISTFLINTCVQAALLLIGASLIQRGRLTAEVLLAFMLYQGQLQSETLNLFQSYSSLIKSSGAGDKVFALLDRRPPPPATGSRDVLAVGDDDDEEEDEAGAGDDDDAGEGGGEGSTGTAQSVPPPRRSRGHAYRNGVRFRGVGFAYPSRPARVVLDGLELDVPAGSTVALVGPSGCGKSTVIGLLQRLYDPEFGSISVDGEDLRTVDVRSHRRRIGIVTQDPTLFSGTILSNIAYGRLAATREEAVSAAKLANAHSFVTSFPDGYETEVGERGVQLSGGQKQRIAIARAIIKNPSLLLLDEATSALDAESERLVQDALDRLLNANRDMTTVVVAHRLQTVRNADCIVFLEDGQVAEKGTHDELMRHPDGRYRRMVERAGSKGKLPDT